MSSSSRQAKHAWIGVGANLDEPEAQLQLGIKRLCEEPTVSLSLCSSFYQSDPMGPQDQPQYTNAVIRIETVLTPLQLLDQLQAVENAAGRERKERWGARTLDMDLLLYDELELTTERLTIPHPGITLRSFVLIPLLEINPDIFIPGLGRASDYHTSVEDYGLIKLEAQRAP